MSMRHLIRGVASAAAARERVRRTGLAPGGHAVWTADEDAAARRLYPDLQAIMAHTGRSYFAVRSRCQKLGLSPKRHRFTAAEASRLRRVFTKGTKEDILRAFPDRSESSLYEMAKYFGFHRPRRTFVITGIAIIDMIRQRCFELNLSMADLDKMAGTKHYFTDAGWHASTALNPKAVFKAVRALDGELIARWNDEDGEAAVAGQAPRPYLLPSPEMVPAAAVA